MVFLRAVDVHTVQKHSNDHVLYRKLKRYDCRDPQPYEIDMFINRFAAMEHDV